MNNFKIYLFYILIFFSMNVKAAHFNDTFTIESITPSTIGMHVKLSPNPTQCTGNWWGNQFLIKKEESNYNILTSSILAAYMAGKKIRAVHYSTTGTGDCSHSNWLTIYTFQVIN